MNVAAALGSNRGEPYDPNARCDACHDLYLGTPPCPQCEFNVVVPLPGNEDAVTMFIDMVRSGSILSGWSYQEARCYAEMNDFTLSDIEKVSRILIPELSAAKSKISSTEAEKNRNRLNKNGR